MARQRITTAHVNRLRERLSDTDAAIVNTFTRVRLATGQQLERLLFADRPSGDRQCRRRLNRLVRLRVLARLERRIGGVRAGSAGFVYALDVAGQRLLHGHGRPRRPWTPGLGFLQHTLDVSELYVRLAEAQRRGELELLDFTSEPACWRTFLGMGGERVTLKPDAWLRLGFAEFEDGWFIEVDRATTGTTALKRKFDRYRAYWQSGREQARHGVFPGVLWTAPNEARQQLLVEVASRQPAEAWQLFQIVPFEEVVQALLGGSHDGAALGALSLQRGRGRHPRRASRWLPGAGLR